MQAGWMSVKGIRSQMEFELNFQLPLTKTDRFRPLVWSSAGPFKGKREGTEIANDIGGTPAPLSRLITHTLTQLTFLIM